MDCGAGKYGVATGQTAEGSCTPCGAGTYSTSAGTTCTVGDTSVQVKLLVCLPIPLSEFNDAKQQMFKESIASTAGVEVSQVTIRITDLTSTLPHRKLLSADCIKIDVEITDKDTEKENIVSLMTAEKINVLLTKTGLPSIEVLSRAQVVQALDESTNQEITASGNTSNQSTTNIPIIIGSVGGLALLLCILASCYYFRCWQSKHPAGDAQGGRPCPRPAFAEIRSSYAYDHEKGRSDGSVEMGVRVDSDGRGRPDHEVSEEAVKDMLVRVREQTLRPFIHP
jgi:hypothetical protein